MKYATALILPLLITTACGLKEDAQDREGVLEYTASEILNDAEANSLTVTDQLEEAIASLAQTSQSSDSASFSLTGTKEAVKTRSCEKDDEGKLNVDIEKSLSLEIERINKLSIERNAKITRVWSHESEEINCDDSGKYADIKDMKGAGLSLSVSFERSKSASGTKRGNSFSRSFSSEGTRSISYISSEADDQYETNVANLSFSIERSADINMKNKVLSYTSKSEAEDLQIKVVRDIDSKSWISKEIISGKVSSVLNNGLEVETDFTNVVFEKSDNECQPVSGLISGTIKLSPSEGESSEETSEENSIEFSADFSVDGSSISIEGQDEEILLDGCDLAGL